MQYVNRIKLVSILAANGMKKRELAEELCITPANLTLKISGRRQFTEGEIAAMYVLFGNSIFLQ